MGLRVMADGDLLRQLFCSPGRAPPKKRRPGRIQSVGDHRKLKRELLLESIPVSLLDESGQRTTIFRFSLESIAGGRALAVLDGLGDFGGDFLLHFDVVEAVFHKKSSLVEVKGYVNITSLPAHVKRKKSFFRKKSEIYAKKSEKKRI